MITLCSVGSSCDFDKKTKHEDYPCSSWTSPPATDGKTGFFRTSGQRMQDVRKKQKAYLQQVFDAPLYDADGNSTG